MIKVDGTPRGQERHLDVDIPIPETEPDHVTPLCGNMISQNFSVFYYMRVFVHYKSIFEIGPGHCVSFPVFILNKPDRNFDADASNVNSMTLPNVEEFNCNDVNDQMVFMHKRDDFWNQLNTPEPGHHASLSRDREHNEMKYPKFEQVIKDDEQKVSLPAIDDPDIFVMGLEEKNIPWIDYSCVNDP